MAKTKKAVLTETIIAAAAIVQKRFVNFEGKQATAGQPATAWPWMRWASCWWNPAAHWPQAMPWLRTRRAAR